MLTNQFPDILPGSAISAGYVYAQADYQRLAGLGQVVLDHATESLAGAINLDHDALVVFNPSPFPSADYLELPPSTVDGLSVPTQTTADAGLPVWCEGVPANGYQTLGIESGVTSPAPGPL